MISRISNLNAIKTYLQSQQTEYKDLAIDEVEILDHLEQLDSGNGLRILNSLEPNSTGVFLFNSNGFKILCDKNGFSHLYKISDDTAIQLMQHYYICRSLAKIPKYYDDVIIAHNQELNNIVNEIVLG